VPDFPTGHLLAQGWSDIAVCRSRINLGASNDVVTIVNGESGFDLGDPHTIIGRFELGKIDCFLVLGIGRMLV